MPFQNSLSYCGRLIFRFSFSLDIYLCSKSFFRMKSAFSTILYFFCHFQPHLLCCIHDRLINILHKYDCVHHLYFWIFGHNNFTWAQRTPFRKVVFNQLFIANIWLHITHTALLFFHEGFCSYVQLKFIFNTCPIFLSNVSWQHVATFILRFNWLFIVHFHSVEDIFHVLHVTFDLIIWWVLLTTALWMWTAAHSE